MSRIVVRVSAGCHIVTDPRQHPEHPEDGTVRDDMLAVHWHDNFGYRFFFTMWEAMSNGMPEGTNTGVIGKSPQITAARWGHLVIEGVPTPIKDAKLYPGGARPWTWAETGTHHRPGIQPGDVDELLARGATMIVLSRGMLGLLATAPETVALLQRRGIPVVHLRTLEAVRLYNRLARSRPVGALIHSTC